MKISPQDKLNIDRALASRSLSQFAKMAWHILEPSTPLKWGWCLDAVSEHLEAVSSGEIKRLLINIPPGAMKSLMTNVIFPAWEWGPKDMQEKRFIGTSHNQTLAVRDSLKCRRLITSEWYQNRWNVELTGDQNAKSKFENSKTGFREAMSFTSMTGARGDRVTLDDPISADNANSDAELENVRVTFTETLPTRVNNEDSAIIVVMQRLNERDTSGVIKDMNLPYEHLCIPMEFEPNRKCFTSIGWEDPRTKDGELMFPERFSRKQVDELKLTLGSYGTAGQLQQRPAPSDGGIIKKGNFKYYDELPTFDYIDFSCDTAFKEKESSDYSCIGIWGVNSDGYYLINRIKDRMNYNRLKQRLIDTYTIHKPRFVLIEDKASGQSLIQDLTSTTVMPIKPIQVDKDKVTRAYSCQPEIENGKVFLPNGADWLDDYLEELVLFPNGKHDDQVDMTTQYLNFMKSFRELDLWVA